MASGLLALNLIGCVQTTDGVYSRQGEDWNESVNFFDNNAYRITSLMTEKVGGYYAFIDTWGEIFLTEDFKTSTKSPALKNSLSRVDSVLATAIWKQGTLKAIVVTSEENYYTNAKCGTWRTPGAFFIKKDLDFWITKNFDTTWTHLTLSFGQGTNSLNVVESAGVISAYNYSQPNSLFISFDGGNSFKRSKNLIVTIILVQFSQLKH